MPSPSEQVKYQTTTMLQLLRGVKADQWGNPTPCEKWTVRDLANHLVGGGRMVAASFRGETVEIDPEAPMPDMCGDDPVGAVAAALADFEAAADAPGAMEHDVTLPFATLPAQVALNIAKFDILVHCWDLATATGQTFNPPDDVVVEGQQMAEMLIAPQARDGDTFKDVVGTTAGATPMQRLAAFTGRQV